MFKLKVLLSALFILLTINPGLAWFTNSTAPNFKHLCRCLVLHGVRKSQIVQRGSGKTYDELNWQWNKINGEVTPLAYLVAKVESDVQSAVKCCRSKKIRIVARSGGHSYLKYSFGDSSALVVDMSRFTKISVNTKTMTAEIGPGSRNGLMHYELYKACECRMPLGTCPSVALGGLGSGGGFGVGSRYSGTVADHVIGMEVVDAKGKLLTVNKHTNKDLFWALRGGGAGNFCIITKYIVKIMKAPKSVPVGQYHFSFDDFEKFFSAWQDLIYSRKRADSETTFVALTEGDIEMHMYDIVGKDVDFGRTLKKYRFPTPTNSSMRRATYPDFVLDLTALYVSKPITKLSELPTDRSNSEGNLKAKSLIIGQKIGKKDISKQYALLKSFLKTKDKNNISGVLIDELGGAMAKVPVDATALRHRKSYFIMQLLFLDDGKDPKNFKDMSDKMNNIFDINKKVFNSEGSYVNYLDGDLTDPLHRYYGDNLERLITVKSQYDPDNIFNYRNSIPVKSK